MSSLKNVLAMVALAALASAKTITITATSDNKFDPDTVDAGKGDVLEFHFEPKNHSVVAGSYQYPCSPLEYGTNGSFYSGFLDSDSGEADKVFRVTMNDSSTIPFYSSQGNECADGMVGIINPTDKKNLSSFEKAASELSRAVTPGHSIYGGELADNNGDSKDNGDDSSSGDSNSDSSNSDSSGNGDDDDAAAGIRVPLISLLVGVGACFFLA